MTRTDQGAFEAELIAVTDDAVIVTDASGVISYYNRSAETMFRYPREQAIGATLDLIIPERLRERHWEGLPASDHERDDQ